MLTLRSRLVRATALKRERRSWPGSTVRSECRTWEMTPVTEISTIQRMSSSGRESIFCTKVHSVSRLSPAKSSRASRGAHVGSRRGQSIRAKEGQTSPGRVERAESAVAAGGRRSRSAASSFVCARPSPARSTRPSRHSRHSCLLSQTAGALRSQRPRPTPRFSRHLQPRSLRHRLSFTRPPSFAERSSPSGALVSCVSFAPSTMAWSRCCGDVAIIGTC